MKKKLFTLLLAVAVSIGTMFAEKVKIGDLYYNLDATNHTAEVTYQLSWSENNYSGLTAATIPASVTYNSVSYSVTSIGEGAFNQCTGLFSVTIPNSVTSIGDYAFLNCSGLTSVTIPNSVTSIGSSAFGDCTGLTSVTIPNSVASIGNYAFADCTGLTSINVASDNSNYCSVDGVLFNKDKTTLIQYPGGKQGAYTISDGIESIADEAFDNCDGLTSVTIPNSVTSIGDEAFYGCSGLTSVTIGNSVTSIGDGAFDGCTGLTSVVWNAKNCSDFASYNTPFYAGYLYNFDLRPQITSFTFGNEVEHIPAYLCNGMSNLTSIVIPNSVTSIGESAFEGCTDLTSVTIGNSVTSIGESAFRGCTDLTSVTIPNSVTSIGNSAFSGCSDLTSVTIGNSVTSIGDYAFCNCTDLTSVTIPNSVTSIGNSAFRDCSGLFSVTIPNSVTSIGEAAFWGCAGLTSVTIPNSVTSIGDRAFFGCSGLTSVTIGNSVTSIGYGAFASCSGLTSITCEAITPPTLSSYVFYNVNKSIPLYVPAESIEAYQAADQWKDFTNILTIGAQPADVTTTTVTPSETTADIAWPQVTGAATYTIEIKKNGELICTITFNAQGQLISIALAAPSRNNAPQRAQAAGFSFTITSLDSGTTYSYTMTAKDNNGNVLKTESGTFTTTGDAQGVDQVLSDQVQSTKILHNGQIYILRGEKVYTLTGQEVK